MLQAVKISNGLIAMLPRSARLTQPYVILLNPANGRVAKIRLSAARKPRRRVSMH